MSSTSIRPSVKIAGRRCPSSPTPTRSDTSGYEVPPLRPYIKETRRHEVACPCCGHNTRAAYDEQEIAVSPFGPRLMGVVALLTGVYHVSRRSAAKLLSDLVGIPISLGAVSAVEARVSDAVEPPVAEAWQRVEGAPIKHTDGTTWLKAGTVLALWTIASTAATVFKNVADGSRATLAPLYGALRGILVSDRATALAFWAMERRQICWAHLLRKVRVVLRARRAGRRVRAAAPRPHRVAVPTGTTTRRAGWTARRSLRGWLRCAHRSRPCSSVRSRPESTDSPARAPTNARRHCRPPRGTAQRVG